jgi:hypothetical protein
VATLRQRFAILGAVLVCWVVPAQAADSDRLHSCQAVAAVQEPSVVVHGRLYAANGGGSGFRIWRIGTNRLLWVTAKVDPSLPREVRETFRGFEEELYGDFTLVPIRPERAGVMREVCLVSGAHLVVKSIATGVARKVP